MQSLFSPDSKVMQAMSRISDLLILNVLFLLSCVPIFTIGAASTAMYTVCFRLGTEREQGVFRSYFAAFRDNFRQSTVLWLILLLFMLISLTNILIFSRIGGLLRWLCLVPSVLLLLAVLILGYVFPLLSQFSNSTLTTFKNAFYLSIGYLPRSLLITFFNVFPFALAFADLYLFLQSGFLWISLYFSAAAYLNALLLNKVFAPYLGKEDRS